MKSIRIIIKIGILFFIIIVILAYTSNKESFTPLHIAAWNGNYKQAEMLVNKKENLEARSKYGQTPLHYAVFMNNYDIVELLIKKGADVNAANIKRYRPFPPMGPLYYHEIEGVTPLHCATTTDTAQLLLNNGAKIESKNIHGETPLFYAIRSSANNVVELLLKNGAVINIQSKRGLTPLHLAVENHLRLSTIQMLLEKGADTNAKTEKGETPLDIAERKRYKDIVELLNSYMSKK